MSVKYNLSPSREYPWFITNPQGDTLYYKTEKDMLAGQREVISEYCDDGWSEEVEEIMAGKITHVCSQTDKRGDLSGEFDYICDYELKKL